MATRAVNDTVGKIFPVAIGGIGGSGTRIVALLLHLLGYYLGDDLNEMMDNHWFTLLFKRRSVLLETEDAFANLAALFHSRMTGTLEISEAQRQHLLELAADDRLLHPCDWLRDRVASFCRQGTLVPPERGWGWKEPNTHIVIDRLQKLRSELRYIHVVRHPIDMSVSSNQAQLQLWGPSFLDREVSITPRDSLSFWCAAYRRIVKVQQTSPQRVLTIDIEKLCAEPEFACEKIAQFLGTSISGHVISNLELLIRRPGSFGRYRGVDIRQFDRRDIEYVSALGYCLP